MAVVIICSSILAFIVSSSEQSSLEGRIVNGIPTTAEEYPFIVSIRTNLNEYNYSICTGSLIRKAYPATVLTAAHCLDFEEDISYYFPSNFTLEFEVHLSRTDVDAPMSSNNNFTYFRTLNFTFHEDFDSRSAENDIGLIFLDVDLSNEDRLTTATIGSLSDEGACCSNHEALQVIGYGLAEQHGDETDTLNYADQIFIDREECQDRYQHYYDHWDVCVNNSLYFEGNWSYVNYTAFYMCEKAHDTGNLTFNSDFPDHVDHNDWVTVEMICAAGNNSDACQGDSGGPLIKAGTNIQVGITSWGIGCNRNTPGVYTNVARFRAWIQTQTNEMLESMAGTIKLADNLLELVNASNKYGDGSGASNINNAQQGFFLQSVCLTVVAFFHLVVL